LCVSTRKYLTTRTSFSRRATWANSDSGGKAISARSRNGFRDEPGMISTGPPLNYRWAHPGQQQGRRFPSLRLAQPHSIRRLLVSAFLADSIQQIHSLRASGVMSSHAVNACGSDVSVFLKSAGTSCTTPLEIFFCDIDKLVFRKPQRRAVRKLTPSSGLSSIWIPGLPIRQPLARRPNLVSPRVVDRQ
jgi:hypothetical protein